MERLNIVREAVRAADDRIAALALAFDESSENSAYMFDHRDGSRVHVSEYRMFSGEERADMQSAREERLERMGYTWVNGGYLEGGGGAT